MHRVKTVIMGAAGRDFHNFNTVYRDNEAFDVVAFTATQIPNIDGRKYPASLAGQAVSDGHPDRRRTRPRDLDSQARDRGGGLRLQRRALQLRHEPQFDRHRMRRALQAPGWPADDDHEHEAGHLGVRGPDRIGQEPDQPPRGAPASAARPESGRRPTPDAVRGPREAEGPALRQPGRSQEEQVHHRGDGGIRAAHRRGNHHLRGRGLRRHPRTGAGRGGRHPVGRREQRPAVLQAGHGHRRGRPAARRERAELLPGGGQPADGRRHHHQQDRQRRAEGGGTAASQHSHGQRHGRSWSMPRRPSTSIAPSG